MRGWYQFYPAGEYFGGGIIFYVDGSGQHGLIASTKEVYAIVHTHYGFYLPISQSNALLRHPNSAND